MADLPVPPSPKRSTLLEGAARHQKAGVFKHLLALLLIAQQLYGVGAVRVGHRDQAAVFPKEGPVFGVQPRPVLPVEGGESVEVKGTSVRHWGSPASTGANSGGSRGWMASRKQL